MKTLTIGKMAKLNGISEQTLRLYDKMGLVVPCEINKSTGYRYYNIRQCAQLDMIQYLKSFNMTLAQIKDCFDTHSTDKLISMLKEQKNIVEDNIRELRQADWAIDQGYTEIATIDNIGNEYTSGLVQTFKDEYEAKGGTIVTAETFQTNESDFKAILTNIKNRLRRSYAFTN